MSVYTLKDDPNCKAIIATCWGCMWRDHAVQFSYLSEFDPEDTRTIDLDFLIYPQRNIFVRLWRAIRYVFGFKMIGWYGIELTEQNAKIVSEFLVTFLNPTR